MALRNRGKAPQDILLFNEKMQGIFYDAVSDLSFLLERGYGSKSSLQLVGNRYRLNARQQKALQGMTASKKSIILRKGKECSEKYLIGKTVIIDGFNLLIILETAISGGFIFKGQDGAYRDVTSVHGGYKRVKKTEEAILTIGKAIKELKIEKAIWYLDAPISNSGRLKTFIREIAEREKFNWEINLDHNPDKVLISSDDIIISSDAWILEEGKKWFNLIGHLIKNHLKNVSLFHSEPSKKIALVTCVKNKRTKKSKAINLYQGALFEKFISTAESHQPDQIFILSGKHGLLNPEREIEPYDLNLTLQSEGYKKEWSSQVISELKKITNLDRDEFIIIAHPEYYKGLTPHLKNHIIPIDIQ